MLFRSVHPVEVRLPEDGAPAREKRRLEEAEAALDGRRKERDRRVLRAHGATPPAPSVVIAATNSRDFASVSRHSASALESHTIPPPA